jgi:ephrin-B
MRTHFVYWNSTNPAFRLDNTDHIIDVNEGNLPWEYDQLHLICPQNGEQHVIYSVSKEDFESCRVSNSRPKIVAICNKPDSFMYFTITFRSFSPTPGGMEFKAGQDYYFISTSTTRDLHRRVGGYCATHNMRMVFRVAERELPQQDSNVVQVQVNQPRRVPATTTTTAAPSRAWSARVPQDRQDYIYYYQPWHAGERRAERERVRMEELASNEILTALPLTSSAPGAALALPALLLAALRTLL